MRPVAPNRTGLGSMHQHGTTSGSYPAKYSNAERVGFEPTVSLHLHILSRDARSASLAPLQEEQVETPVIPGCPWHQQSDSPWACYRGAVTTRVSQLAAQPAITVCSSGRSRIRTRVAVTPICFQNSAHRPLGHSSRLWNYRIQTAARRRWDSNPRGIFRPPSCFRNSPLMSTWVHRRR